VHTIIGIFWNRAEGRLRALWRLLGQLILLFLMMLPLQLVTTVIAMAYLLSQKTLPPAELTNPLVLQKYIVQSPFLMMVSSIVTLTAFLLSIWIAGRILDKRPFSDFGLHLNRNWWVDFGFGLFLGALLVSLIFLVQLTTGWITIGRAFVTNDSQMAFPLAILAYLVTFIAVGIQEELFYRGYQLKNLAEGLKGKAISPQTAILLSTLLTSIVFGVMHMTNPNSSLVSTVNIIFAGVFLLAVGYILTGELAISIGVHITWNFFMGNIYGFPVSGIDFSGVTLIATQQSGPPLWTGGAFGPEAGLLGSLAMLLGGLLTALWVQRRHGGIALNQHVAEPPCRGIRNVSQNEPGSGL
jgi:membrane protease YdiL (CAAX protease family)